MSFQFLRPWQRTYSPLSIQGEGHTESFSLRFKCYSATRIFSCVDTYEKCWHILQELKSHLYIPRKKMKYMIYRSKVLCLHVVVAEQLFFPDLSSNYDFPFISSFVFDSRRDRFFSQFSVNYKEKSSTAARGGAQRSVFGVNEPQTMGGRRARACTRSGKTASSYQLCKELIKMYNHNKKKLIYQSGQYVDCRETLKTIYVSKQETEVYNLV